jgi:glycosyltransferase involved in cell wall biosynthesis
VTLTVSMSYYRCQPFVQKAVASILDQSFTDLRLVLVNDGDTTPHLTSQQRMDPRLTVLDLEVNRGPYYCDAVVLAACDTPWFSIHASDDWSKPNRLATLMAASDGYDVVFGGSIHHKRRITNERETNFALAATEDVLLHRGSFCVGIFRTEALRRIGGPHPDFRVAYDTMQVHLVCRALRWRHLPDEFGYQRVWRSDSLTKSPETGMHSPLRNEARARRDALWRRVIAAPQAEWPALLAPSPEMAAQVAADAQRLRQLMETGHAPPLALTTSMAPHA